MWQLKEHETRGTETITGVICATCVEITCFVEANDQDSRISASLQGSAWSNERYVEVSL